MFPNVAITRASRNLSLFEYNPGGDGLTRDTVFENFQNYRISTLYFVMIFALFTQTSLGMII